VCSFLNISNNSFYYGKTPISIVGSYSSNLVGYNQTISDNFFIRPFVSGISVSDFGGSCAIKGNNFIDVVATSASSVAISNNCVSTYSGSPIVNCMTVANNTLTTIGTTGFTYLNTVGLSISNGSLTQKTLVSGNDFTLASTVYNASNDSIFTENVTGDRIIRTTGSTAPSSGTWKVGDRVVLDSPTAGGYIGYVCTTAGTPGTWKGYGAIQA